MKAYVEFHDGQSAILDGVGTRTFYDGRVYFEITPENVVRVQNRGRPSPISLNSKTYPAQPVYVKRVLAQDDTLKPELMPLNGTRVWEQPFIKGAYVLIDEGDPKVPAANDPLSNQYHLLDGGDCFAIRFVDPANPFTPIEERTQECLDLLNFDKHLFKSYPLLADLLDLYKVNGDSINPASMKRNFGWWLWPECYHSRWGDFPPMSYLKSQYGFLSTWANSDGLCNEHYDHPLFWLLRSMLVNDADTIAGRELGLHLLRKKVCYGLYDIDDSTHPYWGQWKYEKGNRLGYYMAPSAAKEWDTALVIAYLLTSEPMFERALKVRVESLLTRPNAKVWPRAAGGRMAGRYLQNLLIMHKANIFGRGDEFAAKAGSFLDYFFAALKPHEMWIPNDYDKDWTDTWEGMTFYNFALKWMDMGIGTQHMPRLMEMLKWTTHAAWTWRDESRNIPQVAYRVRVDGSAPATNWNEIPYHMAFWTQLWPRIVAEYSDLADFATAAEPALYGYIGRTWSEIDADKPPLAPGTLRVDQPGFGPSAEKQWPMILESLVRY